MTEPTWTILVATLGERRALFDRLMDVLLPQLDAHAGQAKVMAYWNNGAPHLTEIRQRMVEATTTEYLCCVDDDDLVPDYYVAEVMAALAKHPHYVGWQVQCYEDDRPTNMSYHSLRYRRWYSNRRGHFRDISHLNPIRTQIAQLVDYRKTQPGWPEDRAWVQQLRETHRLQTEVTIKRVMYHYLFSTSKTAGIGSRWRAPDLIQRTGYEPLSIDHPYFSYYPGCLNA
jgi:hypothetical protein